MVELTGTVEVRGQEVKWQRNPATGGWVLMFGGCETIFLDAEPTPEIAAVALESYDQGKRYGQRIGRSILQNEFRNLMDVQPR